MASLLVDYITGQVFLFDAVVVSGGTSFVKFNAYTAATDIRISNIETTFITGGTNLGTNGSEGLFSAIVGQNLGFKNLVAGSNIFLTPSSTGITISSTGGGGGGGGISFASNGLSLKGVNDRVVLGGALTGNTTITTSSSNRLFISGFPIQYSTNLFGSYNPRSLADYGSVTGLTSLMLTKTSFNIYSGSTAPAQFQSHSSIVTYTGNTAPNTFVLKNTFNAYTGTTIYAKDIIIDHASGSTYRSVQDFINISYSAGAADGLKLSNDGFNNLSISTGTSVFRTIEDDTVSTIIFTHQSGFTLTVPQPNILYYVGMLYNNGNPIPQLRLSDNWNGTTEFPLGNTIFIEGTLLTFNNPFSVNDTINKLTARLDAEGALIRDQNQGGLILGETGTRFITLTSGVIWSRLNKNTLDSVDTSAGGFAFTFYFSGGTSTGATWVVGANPQWDNLHYNDITSTDGLVLLGDNKFANLWFYISVNTGIIAYVYGTGQYDSGALAKLESPPSFLPPGLSSVGMLVGRIVFQKSGSTATSIDSAFEETFTSSSISNHNNLSGLQGGSSNEYYHLTNSSYNNVLGLPVYTASTNAIIVTGATNIGNGNGLFTTVSEHNIQIKSLVAGNNIVLTPSSTGITISSTATGGGGGGSGYMVQIVTATTTITTITGTTKYLVDCSNGDVTINLATVIGNTSNITIKKIDSTSNKIIIDGFSTQTIDGSLTKQVLFQYTSITLFTDGANWYIE